MQQKNRPIHEIRLGAIKAAVWKNENDNGVRYSVNLARLYRDGEDWKQTEYFGRDDLLLLAKVADTAHTWICEQTQTQAQATPSAAPEKPAGGTGRFRQPG